MTVDIAMLSEAQKRWILAARPIESFGGALSTFRRRQPATPFIGWAFGFGAECSLNVVVKPAPYFSRIIVMQVEQRHLDCPFCGKAPERVGTRVLCDGLIDGNPIHSTFTMSPEEWNTRFEASLPPSAPVDRDAATTAVVGALTWIREFCRSKREGTDDWFDLVEIEARCSDALASLGTPSVLAESTSNDCLLVAEAVRERCAGICDSNAAQEREGMAELTTQRDRLAAENAAHMAEMLGAEIRSLAVSGVGVG
jgi:hypothetical protein